MEQQSMPNDPKGWPTLAEAMFSEKLRLAYQSDLEQQFPGRGENLYVHSVLLMAAGLFKTLVEEDDLADILNAGLAEGAIQWRLVRLT
jgi:hypothetical protein